MLMTEVVQYSGVSMSIFSGVLERGIDYSFAMILNDYFLLFFCTQEAVGLFAEGPLRLLK